MVASWGLGLLALRQGDLHRALPQLERALGLCQDTDLPIWFSTRWLRPWVRRIPSAGALPTPCRYSRRRWNGPLPRTGQAPQALVSPPGGGAGAGRPPGGGACPRRAGAGLARAHQDAVTRRMPCASSVRSPCIAIPRTSTQAEAHYRQALALAEELGMRPLQRPLPPRPRHAVCHDRPAGAGPRRALDGHRDVPGDGHDLLAAPDRGSTGAGGRAMTIGGMFGIRAKTGHSNVCPIK